MRLRREEDMKKPTMNPHQVAVYALVEHDLRTDLDRLSDTGMDAVPRIDEVRDLLQEADDIIESVFVEGWAGPEEADKVIKRNLKKIAKENSTSHG
jgi:hypothetical protein